MQEVKAKKQFFPEVVELENDTRKWCSCGDSNTNPFCDDSHHITGKCQPVEFSIQEKQTVWLCMCKESANAPFCDGTHKEVNIR